MTQRRTSNEIINATLLEVFLTLVFVVLTVAVSAKKLAGQMKNKLSAEEQTAAASVASLKDEVKSLQDGITSLRRERESLKSQIASLQDQLKLAQSQRARFNSPFRPQCDPDAKPKTFATFFLNVPGIIVIHVNRDKLRYRQGQEFPVPLDDFEDFFADIREYSRVHECRFPVAIEDSDTLPKNAFKEDLAVIRGVFYW